MDGSDPAHPNDWLRQERIRRHWRQRDVAEHLGTTIVTVNRWERGIQQPGIYFRIRLCALFGKSGEELGFFPSSQHLPNANGTRSTISRQSPFFSEPCTCGSKLWVQHILS